MQVGGLGENVHVEIDGRMRLVKVIEVTENGIRVESVRSSLHCLSSLQFPSALLLSACSTVIAFFLPHFLAAFAQGTTVDS